MGILKIAASSSALFALGLSLATSTASAEATGQCDAWDVEYALSANLMLKDTPMGAGDGTYSVGPGKVVLRYEGHEGEPRAVKMISYSMQEQFTIHSKTLFWTTTVITDTKTAAAREGCGFAAEGILSDRTLRWTSTVSNYHTDGTLTCTGSFCGTAGAPPPGTSELHIPPHAVSFSPFEFSPDGKTFTMSSTFVSKTDMPKQTAYVSLAGREVRRTCVSANACK